MFLFFLLLFLSTKLLFTFRTTGMTTNGPATISKHLPLIGQSIYRTALLALLVVSYVSVSILCCSDSESHSIFLMSACYITNRKMWSCPCSCTFEQLNNNNDMSMPMKSTLKSTNLKPKPPTPSLTPSQLRRHYDCRCRSKIHVPAPSHVFSIHLCISSFPF